MTTAERSVWSDFLANRKPRQHARDYSAERGISEGQLLASGAGEGITPLRAEWSTLFEALPSLGAVKTLTRNEHLVLEHWGCYGSESTPPGASLIDVRLFLRHWSAGFAVEEAGPAGVRSSLQFFDRFGDSIHKIYLEDADKRAAFDELVAKYRAETVTWTAEPRVQKEPASGGDAAALQAGWDQLKDTHDFVMLLARLGLERVQALRLAGPDRARPVSNDSLAGVLEQVASRQLPFMIFVGNRGIFQIYTGTIQQLKPMGDWLNVLDPALNLHARQSGIASSWVVRKPTTDGVVTSLELFDAAGETLALLFGERKFGDPESEEWRKLLHSLEPA